ncbi:tyrosine-type recombinase/integrase [Streptomyces sp. CA-106131]|uniref:tyrosine-type recombinase/integrase n=1 Tax=Streptomyces sp. CA-106131 TaxID=3240045 RepID=UPI003D89E3F7
MAEVYDRWHLSRPQSGAEPCAEHASKTRVLVPSSDHGQGKRWQVRYRDAKGQQRKENFERRADADRRAAAVETDLNRGEFVDRAAGKETLRSYAEKWRATAVHRETTSDGVERSLRLHIYPILGDRPLAAIRRSDIQSWVKDRQQVLKPSTLRTTYSRLVTIFRTALHDGVIRTNPCDGVKLPPARKPEIVLLSSAAVHALTAAAPEHYRALILLAAASGLRQGELFGLEQGHIDFLRRTVKVNQQLVGPDRGVPYIGKPKTHESYRTVPLARVAVDAVAAHLAAFPAQGVVIEDRTDPRKPHMRTAMLIFPSERNEPVRRSNWSRVWGHILDRANEALEEPVPVGSTMHDLRHFYASALIKGGESVKTVQKRLGHSKPSITLDIYTHLWPDGEDTTAAAVEATLGPSALVVPSSKINPVNQQVRDASQQ